MVSGSQGTAAVGSGVEDRVGRAEPVAAAQVDTNQLDSLAATLRSYSSFEGDSVLPPSVSPYARGYLEGYKAGSKKASKNRTAKTLASCGCGGCLGLFLNIPGLIAALLLD